MKYLYLSTAPRHIFMISFDIQILAISSAPY